MEQIYRVLVSKQIEYSVEVEAESPQEAMELIEEEIQHSSYIRSVQPIMVNDRRAWREDRC